MRRRHRQPPMDRCASGGHHPAYRAVSLRCHMLLYFGEYYTAARGPRLVGELLQHAHGLPVVHAKGVPRPVHAGAEVDGRHDLARAVDVKHAVRRRQHMLQPDQRARALQRPAPPPSRQPRPARETLLPAVLFAFPRAAMHAGPGQPHAHAGPEQAHGPQRVRQCRGASSSFG